MSMLACRPGEPGLPDCSAWTRMSAAACNVRPSAHERCPLMSRHIRGPLRRGQYLLPGAVVSPQAARLGAGVADALGVSVQFGQLGPAGTALHLVGRDGRVLRNHMGGKSTDRRGRPAEPRYPVRVAIAPPPRAPWSPSTSRRSRGPLSATRATAMRPQKKRSPISRTTTGRLSTRPPRPGTWEPGGNHSPGNRAGRPCRRESGMASRPRTPPPTRSRSSGRAGTSARLRRRRRRDRVRTCREGHGGPFSWVRARRRTRAIPFERRPLRTSGTGPRGRCRQGDQPSPSPLLLPGEVVAA